MHSSNHQHSVRATASLVAVVGVALLSVWAFSIAAEGPVTELPNTFVAGEKAIANEVNENFEMLRSAVVENRSSLQDLSSMVSQGAADKPSQTVVVAKSGGDFESVAAAVDSISDASVDKPYAVLVFPGIYDESDLVQVGPFIHLRGVSRDASIIRGDRTSNVQNNTAAIVELLDMSSISNLTVINEGDAQLSSGIRCTAVSRDVSIEDVSVHVDGNGGVGHIAISAADSDVVLRNVLAVAEGASTLNAAFTSSDSNAGFAQPRILSSELRGLGSQSGVGAQVVNTALEIRDSLVRGEAVGVEANLAGLTRIFESRIETTGLNPAYRQSSAAAILSQGVHFVAGDADGIANQFRYVHCSKANFAPIVNGNGSAIE